MAFRMFALLLTVIVFVMLLAGAVAQQDCTTVLISLSPCLGYITGNSSIPSSQCCTQLAAVVRSQPQCLCEALDGSVSSSLGINIDRTRVLSLPNACNVQTPSVSNCNGSSAKSPSGSPSFSSENGDGLKRVPSTNWEASKGNAAKLTYSLFVLVLLVSSSASVYETNISYFL